MTTLFEENLSLGSDPGECTEFDALGIELAKLNHPACPDVDWPCVERLCLKLFREHGVELHSAAAFALARAQLHGLEGMDDGLCLLNRLLIQDGDRLWPPALPARLEILTWLFTQWQPLLRRQELTLAQEPMLRSLDGGLRRLSECLEGHARGPLVTLLALRKQLQGSMQRVTSPGENSVVAPDGEIESSSRKALGTQSGSVPSVVVLKLGSAESVPPEGKRRTFWPWLLVMAVVAVLTALFWWWIGGSAAGRLAVLSASLKPPSAPLAPKLADPIRLDSLLLFPPDSADLKSGSTKVLINGLINIKAQPGWLIVVTGHSDTSGNSERNLELSRARAEAVKGWMQQMGDIPDSCFIVQGRGADQPIADNNTESGRRANRRVDIQLVPSAGACAS